MISSKVKDRALLAKDFKTGQLPAGPPGANGEQGAKGAPGVSGLQEVFTSSVVNTEHPQARDRDLPGG